MTLGKPYHKKIRLSELKIDPTINREIDERWVATLVATWAATSIGTPVVSHRGNGVYVMIDGQHRVEAYRQVDPGDPYVMCEVYDDLTIAEEAQLFVNKNNMRHVASFDKFRLLVTAEDPDHIAIMEVVSGLGLHVRTGALAGSISAVRVLEQVFTWDKTGELLREALELPKRSWGRDSTSFQGDVMKGFAIFLRSYPQVSRPRLVKKIAGTSGGVSGLLGKARTMKEINGGSVAANIAEWIRTQYNKGNRSGRLEPS